MRTFSVVTLGCRVNQYESEQLAAVLRARGLVQVEQGGDVRVVNTCSVTTSAAKKSRHAARVAGRASAEACPSAIPLAGSPGNRRALPVLAPAPPSTNPVATEVAAPKYPVLALGSACETPTSDESVIPSSATDAVAIDLRSPVPPPLPRVIVAGCWATSHPDDARALPNVGLVLTHHDDVAARLAAYLDAAVTEAPRAAALTEASTSSPARPADDVARRPVGATSLPLLNAPQSSHQRAYLKIQDGCDAHCTYCIIPKLRPVPWSKPIADVIDEARRLVDAGHNELVLTGIFLGAYGHPTALRRRQGESENSLARLVDALARHVPELRRVRLSSLEPGDVNEGLLHALRSSAQVVPHFHLPLQSGSEKILRRMNRQYTRDDYLALIDRLTDAFDRPAMTTDIIAAFPGETDEDFADTLDVARRAHFVHVHAFPYSARPGTAAARWTDRHVPPAVASARVATLTRLAATHDLAYRQSFVGETMPILVERDDETGLIHGKSSRHFDVHFEADIDAPSLAPGTIVTVRVDHVTPDRTTGIRVQHASRGAVV